jgi:hypothetical protein
MVHPVLQEKLIRNIKKYCFHISGLEVKFLKTSGPDGIRAFPPHQVFGFEYEP